MYSTTIEAFPEYQALPRHQRLTARAKQFLFPLSSYSGGSGHQQVNKCVLGHMVASVLKENEAEEWRGRVRVGCDVTEGHRGRCRKGPLWPSLHVARYRVPWLPLAVLPSPLALLLSSLPGAARLPCTVLGKGSPCSSRRGKHPFAPVAEQHSG